MMTLGSACRRGARDHDQAKPMSRLYDEVDAALLGEVKETTKTRKASGRVQRPTTTAAANAAVLPGRIRLRSLGVLCPRNETRFTQSGGEDSGDHDCGFALVRGLVGRRTRRSARQEGGLHTWSFLDRACLLTRRENNRRKHDTAHRGVPALNPGGTLRSAGVSCHARLALFLLPARALLRVRVTRNRP
jgi:hypothetical protein